MLRGGGGSMIGKKEMASPHQSGVSNKKGVEPLTSQCSGEGGVGVVYSEIKAGEDGGFFSGLVWLARWAEVGAIARYNSFRSLPVISDLSRLLHIPPGYLISLPIT